MPPNTYALDTTWRTVLKDLGIVPADALRRAGLPDDLLQQPSVRLIPEQYYRLWNSIEAEFGDSPLAILLCESTRSESFSPPLFASLCSPNMLVAAQRIAQYKALIAPMELHVTEEQDKVVLEFVWLHETPKPPLTFVMMELLFCVTLARLGTRERVCPVDVTTTVLPSPVTEYERFLGTRVRRGTKHRVVFTEADATRPFLTSNEPLWAAFEPALRQRLADLNPKATTGERVRAALLEGIPSGLVTIDAVARRLAVSKRTLQRRIEEEGSSFQQLLNETREALSRHYLVETELPIAEIAFLLGFDETNSFYRAFRNWTGATPDSVRTLQSPS